MDFRDFDNFEPAVKEAPKKIVVVYNKKDNVLIPFKYADNGEIIVLSTKYTDLDNMFVKVVDSYQIDLERGRLYG